MNIKIQKLHPDARVPQYQTPGAACFDLHAIIDERIPGLCVIPWQPEVIRTGLSFEIPQGHVMLVYSRSGHGFKNDTRLANCVGVIDSDYRGEVMIKLTRDQGPGQAIIVRTGDRIAQAMIIPVQQVTFTEAESLSETERGTGGLGSTGVAG